MAEQERPAVSGPSLPSVAKPGEAGHGSMVDKEERPTVVPASYQHAKDARDAD